MIRPMIRIHNIETDEVIDREMNDAEFEQWQKDQEETAQLAVAAAEKAAARQALLARLGLTEEEAKLLLS